MFTSSELRELLEERSCDLVAMSAANFLSVGSSADFERWMGDPERWVQLLEWEARVCAGPGRSTAARTSSRWRACTDAYAGAGWSAKPISLDATSMQTCCILEADSVLSFISTCTASPSISAPNSSPSSSASCPSGNSPVDRP